MPLSPADQAIGHLGAPPPGGIHLIGAPRASKTYSAADIGMTFGALWQPRHPMLVLTNVLKQWTTIWVPELMQAAVRADMLPVDYDPPTRTLSCGPWTIVGADAKDKAAAKRMQGITASALAVDELPNIPREVWIEARKRLTEVDGVPPLLVTTANPEGPGHWAKLDVVDKGVSIPFPPGTNPTVPLSYYRDLKDTLHPIEWERVVTCRWLPTSGLIYPDLPHRSDAALKPDGRKAAGIDGGMSSPTAMVLLEEDVDGAFQITAESYFVPYESRLTVDEAAARLDREIPEGVDCVVDPAASELRQALRALGRRVRSPRWKDVRRGLGQVRKGIADGTLRRRHDAQLPNMDREFGAYTWDAKASDRGEDKPLKKDDHAMDALRYGYSRCVAGAALVTDRTQY